VERSQHQDAVCLFVRDVLERRTGETIVISARPERERRNEPVVEELWDGATRSYAVEHTHVESFGGQIANIERLKRLLTPVREKLRGSLPGYFVLTVREEDTRRAHIAYTLAKEEVERLILEAASTLSVGSSTLLQSTALPFSLGLRLRHTRSSGLVLQSLIDGDTDELLFERYRRAFDEKCPKLFRWAQGGRRSVLVLESDDPQHANVAAAMAVVNRLLNQRTDAPDIIVYVETEVPWYAWVLKDGALVGDDAMRTSDSNYAYERGHG